MNQHNNQQENVPQLPRKSGMRLKAIGIIAILIALIGFHYWFRNYAKNALATLVHNQSKGKLQLNIDQFSFNWINNKIVLDSSVIKSVDHNDPVMYKVKTDRITIKARGFLPLLFRKEMLIDSIRLYNPKIEFTRIKEKIKTKPDVKDTAKSSQKEAKFSVAEEMGRITKSFTDAINLLKIYAFRFDNGSFTMIDKTRPDELPFEVNRIYIELDNLQLDSTIFHPDSNKRSINFTDNIAIRTSDQNIHFPGGRHFLSFKNFRVNLKSKRVEFDSCVLQGKKGDSTSASFSILFDKLALTSINFDSLYNNETIIADSVFCNNPFINLKIDSDQPISKSKKNKPKIQRVEDLVQQLLGDLKLNYVGVINSTIEVNTIRKGKTNTFSASRNNFEIYDLVVRQDEQKPISLSKFQMAMHRAENLIRNGQYAISFDSIGFQNDFINIKEFSFQEIRNGRAIKSLSMPVFRVSNISWESLLYDNIFEAERAVFFRPKINYLIINRKDGKGEARIFQTLNNIDDVMNLKNLDLTQGDILLRFADAATLHLHNTNLSLRADELTNAFQLEGVQHSINSLNFEKGTFNNRDITADLHQVRLAQNKSGLIANNMTITADNLQANAEKIKIGTVVLDSIKQSIIIDGISWENATINLSDLPLKRSDKRKTNGKTPYVLRNINGQNTALHYAIHQYKSGLNISSISLNELSKDSKGNSSISGLEFDGNQFFLLSDDIKLTAKKLNVADNQLSHFYDLRFQKNTGSDSILIAIPFLTIHSNISTLSKGDLLFEQLTVSDPLVDVSLGKRLNSSPETTNTQKEIRIQNLLLERPTLHISIKGNKDSTSTIKWDGKKGDNYLAISNFKSSANAIMNASQVKLLMNNFEYQDSKERNFTSGRNRIKAELKNLFIKNNQPNQEPKWSTEIENLSLDHLQFDSIGRQKARLRFDKGSLHNLIINSSNNKSPLTLMASNPDLNLENFSGSYLSAKNTVTWKDLNLSSGNFNLQNLTLSPTQSLADYQIKKAFNEDYLNLESGQISGTGFELKTQHPDTIFKLKTLKVDNINLFTFKDKRQVDTAKLKPLFVEMLLRQKAKINLDSLIAKNMSVIYWEINKDTDSLGVAFVDDMNVLITNIRNHNLKNSDSVYLMANGKVLGRMATTLNISQAYTDTLGYFRMKLKTDSVSLSAFNQILVPLVGIKVKKGHLRSLELNATGNNIEMKGKVAMFYPGLGIALLDKKNLSHQSFLNKLATSIASIFILRSQNTKKVHNVYFIRNQYKSQINYIIKTTLEAAKTAIGLPAKMKKSPSKNHK